MGCIKKSGVIKYKNKLNTIKTGKIGLCINDDLIGTEREIREVDNLKFKSKVKGTKRERERCGSQGWITEVCSRRRCTEMQEGNAMVVVNKMELRRASEVRIKI